MVPVGGGGAVSDRFSPSWQMTFLVLIHHVCCIFHHNDVFILDCHVSFWSVMAGVMEMIVVFWPIMASLGFFTNIQHWE